MSAGAGLAGAFWSRALREPELAAVWADGATTSYGELAGEAARIGGWLAANGAAPGARVGVLAERGRAAIAAILGTQLAGATYVPLNPAHPPSRLASIVERAELGALIVDRAGVERADALGGAPPARLVLEAERAGPCAAEALSGPVAVRPESAAYLMFTSGSTGAPKGVEVSVAAVRHYLGVVARRYGIGPSDRVSQFFELTFDLSVHDLFATLGAGAQLFVLPASARFAPVQFAAEHELSVWFSVPSTAAFLARVKALRPGVLPSLRLSLFCGEALPAHCARRWREAAPASRIENLYGPTEATIACLVQPCEDELRVTPGRGCVAIGRPFEGMNATVVDERGESVPDGTAGELALSGPQLATGYWRAPELTAARFPERETERRYLTGDRALRDPDGVFHHLGRVDHQVQVLGHRVELEEIDAHLGELAGCEAATVAWPLEAGVAEGLVAFVSGAACAPAEILARLRERLPDYCVPRRIVELEQLPRSLHGKLDRGNLAAWLEREADGPAA